MRTRRANSLSGAAALSESWHGRGVTKVSEVREKVHVRTSLADLGALEELVIDRPGKNTLNFSKGVRLAAAPPGPDNISRQLYFIGGDQSIDVDEARDFLCVGEVVSITYWADKHHLQEERSRPWEHHFGDEGGDRPTLIYDRLNKRLSLTGGSYYIDLADYDGEHSAGIRN